MLSASPSADESQMWIRCPVQSRRLILAWEAAPSDAAASHDRKRWAVGELVLESSTACFRYYHGPEFIRANDGRDLAQLRALGYRGYPAFSVSTETHRERVLEAFLRRLPPVDRSDFDDFLRHYQIDPRKRPDPFVILALTGAKLPSDGFSLIDPLDDVPTYADLVLEIAGTRHYQPAAVPQRWDIIQFYPEAHAQDPMAVRVEFAHGTLGYVNRLQAPKFRQLLEAADVSGWYLRTNGTTERPRAFLFVRVRPRSATAAA